MAAGNVHVNHVWAKPFNQLWILQMNDILGIFSADCSNLCNFWILHSILGRSVHYEVLIRRALHGLLVDESVCWIAGVLHGLTHAWTTPFCWVYSHGSPLALSVRILAAIVIEVLTASTIILKSYRVWSIISRRMRGALFWHSIVHLRHSSNVIVVSLWSLLRVTLIPSKRLFWRNAICTGRTWWLVDSRLSVGSWTSTFCVVSSLWITSRTL